MRDPLSEEAPKRVTILGSTGSVGTSTLKLIASAPGRFAVEALTANRNLDLLAEQVARFRPRFVAVADAALEAAARARIADIDPAIEVAAGPEAVVEAARREADFVMGAIVGAAGLRPTLAAIERGAVIGLANKETLVCAGGIMMEAVRRHGATLLPVDSEHNAIFQVFDFARPERVRRIILTASGGPFRTRARDSLKDITPEEAVRHPNWSMGAKISIDSATMMNKGLERIEAVHLFPVGRDQIEIVVHPQSVIHSMVEYCDGSVLAQLGTPDMCTPIAYALAWPDRIPAPVERLDFARLGRLDFEAPDEERFPALRLAREALEAGESAPIVLNAANEVAVAAFLARRIGFLEITEVVERALQAFSHGPVRSLEDVVAVDEEARRLAAGSLQAAA
ncbi:MAG: 1-deoxy-D-xylulose 5-phosphate reductoisomerase [Rhodothalassiaceae bacterium]|nr:MAG: 1-deoxy-D-xylulose 5-phosphate reductoisomerase [Rhodothalassiaceae bacterium]